MSRIAVVIPSRLQPNPLAAPGRLFLERAVNSIQRQTVAKDHEILIVVGLSPGHVEPPPLTDVAFVTAADPGQAAALNAAVLAASDYYLLAFLEDDDIWEPRKLDYQIAAIEQGFDFVSSNQREVDVEGNFVRYNDFATMSGWLMKRAVWKSVESFDTSYRWHLDTQWLGRLNARAKEIGWRRLHMVEAGADKASRPWLRNVMQFSQAATTAEREPLVVRTVNPNGGMARIAADPVANAESREEHRRMLESFGCYPW